MKAGTAPGKAAPLRPSPSASARVSSESSPYPSPTEREKSQLYFQRYIKHLPGGRRNRDFRSQLV
ncbi:hypothetical protein LNP20_07525 [Klebsiella pneumoniae subsp. pneumoniae]|nr:hypothetical protein [Klebsiella pneumoniae subsp. pneumoniae]